MFKNINMMVNNDGTYDILLSCPAGTDVEFGLEFLSSEKIKNNIHNVKTYIKKHAHDAKIRSVKILVNGVIIATMSFASFMNVYGSVPKYSMAYLYSGTTTQQISYINRTNGALHTVSPTYFDLNPDGSLKVNNISTELISHAHSQGMKVVPFISNHWNREAGVNALLNRENLSTEIANYVAQYNLDGVNVDIENVSHLHVNEMTDFVAKLRQKIDPSKEVSVAVAANPNGWTQGWHGSYDYTKLAENSDYLMIMAYDEHWQGSAPGPVASISFVENSINYALSKTSPDKLVVGLPFYGRIWSSDNTFNGNGIVLSRVNEMVSTYNGSVTFDHHHKSAKAVFTVHSWSPKTTLAGRTLTPGTYTIWYETEESIQAKMALVNKYDLKGVGAWALGQEPSTIWQNYSSWLNQAYIPPPSNPSTGIVTASVLNVRSSPHLSAPILTTFARGLEISISSTSNGWHTIKLANGQTAYVSAAYVDIISTTAPTLPNPTIKGIGYVNTHVLNVHASPTVTSPILITLARGLPVSILDTANGWHTTILANGRIAYVNANLISDTKNPGTSRIGYVNTPVLNVHSAPTTGSQVLITLAHGLPVTILGTSNGWHTTVLANGQTAYVSESLISDTKTPVTSRIGFVNTPVINVRSAPTTNSEVLITLAQGLPVTILGTSNGWHTTILANGRIAYVSENLISETKTSIPQINTTKRGIVNTAVLNVRSAPTTNSKILTTLARGLPITIFETSNGWHTVRLANGQTAYVSANFVRIL